MSTEFSNSKLIKDWWLIFLVMVVLFIFVDFFLFRLGDVREVTLSPLLLFVLLVIQRVTFTHVTNGMWSKIMKAVYIVWFIFTGFYIFLW